MQSDNQDVIDEMLKSFNYLMEQFLKKTTKNYDGLIKGNNNDGTWNVSFNGETYALSPYGAITPSIGKTVKVIIPQGNMNLAYFF